VPQTRAYSFKNSQYFHLEKIPHFRFWITSGLNEHRQDPESVTIAEIAFLENKIKLKKGIGKEKLNSEPYCCN
jgi:hypothetical protein